VLWFNQCDVGVSLAGMRAVAARRMRIRAQGLGEDRAATVADAVRGVVALQAQDIRACRLSVRARTEGLTRSDVDGAVAAGRVVRTWAMRGTLHMLAAEDVGWVVGLLGPHFAKRGAGRRRQLGLDDDTSERGVEAIREELKGGPLTRAELVERIAGHGVVIDPRSQAPAHLLGYAAMTGHICRGPEAGGDEPTYVLTRDWVGEQPVVSGEEALARLAARYLTAYGPATVQDLAAWSGLPMGQARAGFEGVASIEVTLEGERAHVMSVMDSPETGVRLLGHFDTYLLGYRSRELAVPREFDKRIQSGGGFIMPAVLVDGRAVGTWRQARKQGRLMIDIEPFTTIPRRALSGIRAEVADVGRFLGEEAVITGNT
jgi:DNA glycosylase AlkZ-like